MTTLMEERLAGKPFFSDRFENTHTVLGNNIPIIERVGHQHGGLHWFDIIEIVSSRPEVVVVTGYAIQVVMHKLIANRGIASCSHVFWTTVNEFVQTIDVLTHEAKRMSD